MIKVNSSCLLYLPKSQEHTEDFKTPLKIDKLLLIREEVISLTRSMPGRFGILPILNKIGRQSTLYLLASLFGGHFRFVRHKRSHFGHYVQLKFDKQVFQLTIFPTSNSSCNHKGILRSLEPKIRGRSIGGDSDVLQKANKLETNWKIYVQLLIIRQYGGAASVGL